MRESQKRIQIGGRFGNMGAVMITNKLIIMYYVGMYYYYYYYDKAHSSV